MQDNVDFLIGIFDIENRNLLLSDGIYNKYQVAGFVRMVNQAEAIERVGIKRSRYELFISGREADLCT